MSAVIQSIPATDPASERLVDTAERIPGYIDNLCRAGGVMAMREDDAKLIALLDIGEKMLIALWAGESADHQILVATQVRAKALGYQIMETRPATLDMIGLCSEDKQEQAAETELENTEATRRFDQILAQAFQMRASDIHILMLRKNAVVKVRVNGELVQIREYTHKAAELLARAMYSQAEIDSRRNKAAFRSTEFLDASITRSIRVNGKLEELKLRWASGPVWPDQFDVSIRIASIGQENDQRTLSALGFSQDQERVLLAALKQPAGVIVLCGTTGAGKTTTQATLAEIWGERHSGRRLLRTIEDPPEQLIKHARQMPVSRVDGNEDGFHKALRAAMRMDPDALLLGEIRDEVTADLLQQAQQTGHKVFATVHAPSPFTAIWRLEELGITRNRIMGDSFINAIIHQVLVPILCNECKVSYTSGLVAVDMRESIDGAVDPSVLNAAFIRGAGCPHCYNGIIDRRALPTILVPDTRMRMMLRADDELGAMEYWRSGKVASFGETQARSAIEQALLLIERGVLSPVDADLILGRLKDEDGIDHE